MKTIIWNYLEENFNDKKKASFFAHNFDSINSRCNNLTSNLDISIID